VIYNNLNPINSTGNRRYEGVGSFAQSFTQKGTLPTNHFCTDR